MLNMLLLVILFIGINTDTLIALLFIINQCKLTTALYSVVLSDITLWVAGIIIGKTFTIVFPTWITGFMGFLLLWMVIRPQATTTTKQLNQPGFASIFLLCISLGGDNLAVYIPWVTNLNIQSIMIITLVFICCSIAMTLIAKSIILVKPLIYLLKRYSGYCTKLVYLFSGIRIIYNSHVIRHLIAII